MSIVRMKRLRLVASSSEREQIMKLLAFYGVVELSETEVGELPVSEVSTESEEVRESLSKILSATAVAKKYGSFKRGMFSPRPEVRTEDIFSPELINHAVSSAEQINEAEEEISKLCDRKSKLNAELLRLDPWENLKLPLDVPSGRYYTLSLITVPSGVSLESIEDAVKGASELSEVFEISADSSMRYMLVIAYREEFDKVFSALKVLGAASVSFRGIKSTASEEKKRVSDEISKIDEELLEVKKKTAITDEEFNSLLVAEDALQTKLSCEVESEKGVATEYAFYIEGWAPKREEKTLSELFEKNGIAYEFAEPEEGDEPPTLTYNSKIVSPFNVITNMYSAPAYSGIDPNPTMAPFFALFFGIMLSDAGYGLLLMLAGIFALAKMKPRGGFKSFMQLAVICGASTVLWGVLFGGFFGDAISSVYLLFTGNTFPYDTALWFNPTNDPMTMLIFSLILGGIQIVTGMAVKAYMMIRDGEVLAAIFDIGLWWVVFGGAITCIFNAQVGLYVLLAGAIGLILTQGRSKKNIIMKFFSGLLSLYDITGYFSDILSYSRLLALSLSTAVVGNVINTMGVITGPVCFFLVFIIGHVFNIAINLVGSFVHSARLQYVEYFGKFYESGGRLFAPLTIKSKNTNIIKEEN